jgi:hypothetical protein
MERRFFYLVAILLGDSMRRFLICALFFFLVACSNKQDVQPDTHPIQDVVKHDQQSIRAHIGKDWGIHFPEVSIGFVSDEERNVEPMKRSPNGDIHLEKGRPFNYNLLLAADKATTVLVTVLLDYKQVEFELDGKKGLLHELIVEPGGDLELPMRVDVNGEGLHDLIVIAFADPYNRTLDEMYRSSMAARMVGTRAAVFVGQNDRPVQSLEPILRGKAVPQDVTLRLGVAFATASNQGHPSDLDRQLYVAKAKAGAVFDYQIWASNLGLDRAYEYLILFFFDFHQKSIQGRDALPVSLNIDEEAIFDASIQLPKQLGVYQMQLVHVLDPYKSIDNGDVDAPFVFGSPRIAIDAQS